MNNTKKYVFFVMGVSGSGKSTIGKLLAVALAIPFIEGDNYHSKANVRKMAGGQPLNDSDRQGWLLRLNEVASEHIGRGAVISCSALKASYRSILTQDIERNSIFIYLQGTFEEIHERLNTRKGHFMPLELLQTQFNSLEEPKEAIVVGIQNTPEVILKEIIDKIHKKRLPP